MFDMGKMLIIIFRGLYILMSTSLLFEFSILRNKTSIPTTSNFQIYEIFLYVGFFFFSVLVCHLVGFTSLL